MSEIPEQQKNVLELMSEMLKEQETNSAIQAQNSNHLNGVPTPSPRPNNDNSYNLDSKVSKNYFSIYFLKISIFF